VSFDIYVYFKKPKNFSKEQCESYFKDFGISIQIHPDYDIENAFGFLPFCIKADFISDSLKNNDYLSGFELYSEQYFYNKELKNIQSEGIKKAFFKRKYIANNSIDNILKKCDNYFTISLGSQDSFEPLLACLFSLYISKYFNGVVFYCQSGEYISDFENDIKGIITDLKSDFISGNLKTHIFEKWL